MNWERCRLCGMILSSCLKHKDHPCHVGVNGCSKLLHASPSRLSRPPPVWVPNPLRTSVRPGLRSQALGQGPFLCLSTPVLSLEPVARGKQTGGACRECTCGWKDSHGGDFLQLTMEVSWTPRPPSHPSLPGATRRLVCTARAAGSWPLSYPSSCFLTLPGWAKRPSCSPGLSQSEGEAIGVALWAP